MKVDISFGFERRRELGRVLSEKVCLLFIVEGEIRE